MTDAPTPTMPAAFLGHGNPMNALERNRYTEAWRAFGASAPTPRAILCVSAHWYIGATAVTAMASPRTIHDFYGFPDELFAIEYPAPGLPELADEVAEVAQPHWVGADRDQWGIDHGTWSVLVHAFPDADIPVVQLSINAEKPLEHHLDLGAKLAALRDRGILVLGSGNVVHNLRAVDFRLAGEGFDWARRYDEAARDLLTTDPGSIAKLAEHPDHRRAVPTPDHFLPVVYLAGLAAASGTQAEALVEGCDAGSLSMTSYGVGSGGAARTDPTVAQAAPDPATPDPSGSFPDPDGVPPEDTNL